MKSIIFTLYLFALALAYIQPTTLCGYAPEGSILDIDPTLIIAYDTTSKETYNFITNRVAIFTDNMFNITGVGVSCNTITELGVVLPCPAKQLFEVVGMPNEVDDKVYKYKYDIGKRYYELALFKDGNNSDNIYMILLSSYQSNSYFADWLKQTKAYNSDKK